MVLKLENVSDWYRWADGKMLPLPSDKHRKVRLEVNCERPTLFKVLTESEAAQDGEGFFLAVVQGYEVIEFKVTGNCLVSAESDGMVFFYTSEKDVWWATIDEAVTFTKPYEHQPVDPLVRAMQETMLLNMQRMEDRLRAQFERKYSGATGGGQGAPAQPAESAAADEEGEGDGDGISPAPSGGGD
jgi:hypothetical protein